MPHCGRGAAVALSRSIKSEKPKPNHKKPKAESNGSRARLGMLKFKSSGLCLAVHLLCPLPLQHLNFPLDHYLDQSTPSHLNLYLTVLPPHPLPLWPPNPFDHQLIQPNPLVHSPNLHCWNFHWTCVPNHHLHHPLIIYILSLLLEILKVFPT